MRLLVNLEICNATLLFIKVSEPPGEQQVQQVHHVQEAVQIQQGGTSQVIYQRPAAQYVEGSSSSTSSDTAAAVYAASNGEMYEGFKLVPCYPTPHVLL